MSYKQSMIVIAIVSLFSVLGAFTPDSSLMAREREGFERGGQMGHHDVRHNNPNLFRSRYEQSLQGSGRHGAAAAGAAAVGAENAAAENAAAGAASQPSQVYVLPSQGQGSK